MKSLKRTLSLLLVAIFIITICPTSVIAINSDISISLRTTSDTTGATAIDKVAPGEYFYLWVDFSNNPTVLNDSLCAMNMFIGYDSSKFTIGTALGQDCTPTVNTAYADGVIGIFWSSENGIYTYDEENDKYVIKDSGKILRIRVTAKTSITASDIASFELLNSGDYDTKLSNFKTIEMPVNLTGVSINIYLPNHIAVTGGVSTVAVPPLAQNNGTTTTAPFTATVYGSTGEVITGETITWSVENVTKPGDLTGVSIGADGAVTVTKDAAAGTYTVTAACGAYTAGTKEFTVTKDPSVLTEIDFIEGTYGNFTIADGKTTIEIRNGIDYGKVEFPLTFTDQYGQEIPRPQGTTYGIYTDAACSEEYTDSEISHDTGSSFNIEQPANGTYYIKVSCGDIDDVLTLHIIKNYGIQYAELTHVRFSGVDGKELTVWAKAGDEVRFNVTANLGYKIAKVYYKDPITENDIDIVKDDISYKLTMPAADVTVKADFVLSEPAAAVVSTDVETPYGTAAQIGVTPPTTIGGITYTYQWYRVSNEIPEQISGANNASYTTDHTLNADTYKYFCAVTADDEDTSVASVTKKSDIIKVTVKMAQISATAQAETVRYSDTTVKTFDFGSPSLYTGAGDVSVTGIIVKETADADEIIGTAPVPVTDNTLTYSLKSGLGADKVGKTATVTVTVSFVNHETIDVPLIITVSDKDLAVVSYTNSNTAYSGDGTSAAPYTRSFNGSALDTTSDDCTAKFNNTDVTAAITGWTFTWYEGETELTGAPTNAGSYRLVIDIAASETVYTGSKTVYFKITPKETEVTWQNNTSYTYNGTDQKGTVAATYTDVDNQTVTAAFAFSGTGTEFKNAGAYTATATTDNKNYTLTNNTLQLTIARKEIKALSGIKAADKVYDGDTTAVLDGSEVVFEGKAEGDDLTVTAAGAFADKNAAADKTVNISQITLGGSSAGNYTLASEGNQAAATAAITPKEVTVSNISANDKVYDGGTAALLNYDTVTFTGKYENDNLTVSGNGTFADADVGTGKTVTITDLMLGGGDKDNYKLASTGQQTTATASITPKPLSTADVNFSTIPVQDYTGEEIKPNPTVTLKEGAALLTEGTDYTLSYANNTEPGSATVQPTVTANFKGNYSGEASTSFVIRKLTSIVVTTEPTKTDYIISGLDDAALNKTDLEVTAHYSDGHQAVVDNGKIDVAYTEGGFNGKSGLDNGDTKVTLKYTEGTVTVSTDLNVTVTVKRVTGLTFTGTCRTSGYYEGQTLDRTGLTITAAFNDNTTAVVTNAATVIYYDNGNNETDETAFLATDSNTKVKFKYSATFCGENSTVESSELTISKVGVTVVWVVGAKSYKHNYDYGDIPSYTYTADADTDPAIYAPDGSTFVGWSDGTKNPNGEPRIFTTDADGKLLYSDQSPVSVSGNVTYRAAYQAAKYTVTFKDSSNNIIETQTVASGKTVTAPDAPQVEGSAFKGWNDGNNVYTVLPAVNSDVTYTAEYVKNVYTVTYYDEDGTPLNKTELVKHGDSINPGFVPEKAGDAQYSYTFDKWVTTKDGNEAAGVITANTSVYASYTRTAKGYTYKFLNEDGTLLSSGTLQYNEPIPAPANPIKASDEQYSYSFTGFSGYTANMPISANVTFYATYKSSIRNYTVTWSVDGKTTTETYGYGSTPAFKGSTDKTAADKIYTFKGWSPAVTAVKADITYTAQYDVTDKEDETFTVTFLNDDSTELSRLTVNKGEQPKAPTATKARDAQYSYVLKGWSDGKTVYAAASLPAATANATYTAVYIRVDILYTVVFTDHDDRVLSVASYKNGTRADDIIKPANPSRTDAQYNYTFTGWSPAVADVTSDAVYTAQYSRTAKTFKLTINTVFSDDSRNDQTQTVNVEYGKTYDVTVPAETGYTAYINGRSYTDATYTTPAITADSSVTLTYRPGVYSLTAECILNTKTVLKEYTLATFNKAKIILIPMRKGYNVSFGGINLKSGCNYDVRWDGSAWNAVENGTITSDNACLTVYYTKAGNTELQLEYLPKTYTLTYELSLGDGSRIDSDVYGLDIDTSVYTPVETTTGSGVKYYYYTKAYKYGEVITPPDVSIYSNSMDTSNYLWTGWEGLPAQMPDTDLTVTGKFTAGQYIYRYVIYDQNGNPIDYYKARSDGDADLNLLYPQDEGFSYSPWNYEPVLMSGDLVNPAIILYSNQTVPAYDLTINYEVDGVNGREAAYTVGNTSGTQIVADGKITIANIPYGTEYSVSSPEIAGYTALMRTVSGSMDAQGKTISVKYDADSYHLTVNYSYNSGLPIKSYSKTYAFGDSYTIDSDTVAGYTPNAASLTGTMGAGDKTFEVIYTPNKYNISITYTYDTVNGAEAAPTYTQTQVDYGTAYNVTSPSIEGYTASKSTVSGILTGDVNENIIYTSGEFTISYYVEGETTVTHSYDRGETVTVYTAPAKTGYTFSGWTWSSGTAPTSMPASNLIATGYYTHDIYTLTIYYKYSDGTTASDTKTKNLYYNDSYNESSPEINGYTADKTTVSGTMDTQNAEITVTYTKNSYKLTVTFDSNVADGTEVDYKIDGGATQQATVTNGKTEIMVPYQSTCVVTAPAVSGYTASPASLSVNMDSVSGKTDSITYTKNSYKLTVTFDSNVADGTEVDYKIDGGATQQATVTNGKIEIMVPYQSTCVVTAPAVSGYTASPASVSVTMGTSAQSESVTYTKNSKGGSGSSGGSTTKADDTISTSTGTVSSASITNALKAGTGKVIITSKTESTTISAADTKKIADGKAELTVTTGKGSVSFTADGLTELTSGADSGSLKVVVDADKDAGKGFKVVSGNTVLGSADVSVYMGDKEISKGFGTLTIKIPVGKALAGQSLSVLHMKDDGSYTVIEATVDADGNAVFSVNSLSAFIVLGKKATAVSSVFTDVKSNDWYEGYVQYVYDEGLMTGVTASEFAPGNSASRAMIVTVLWRMAGSKTGNKDAGFTDLTADWYKEAVNWAFANGITTGKSATEFDPNAAVTREQLAAFLYRYSKLAGKDVSKTTSLDSFTDAAGVSDYAVTAMKWAAASGIIGGRTETTLVPAGNSTRAELATMLTRLK